MENPYVDYTEFYKKVKENGIQLDPLEEIYIPLNDSNFQTPSESDINNNSIKSDKKVSKDNPIKFILKSKDNSNKSLKSKDKDNSNKSLKSKDKDNSNKSEIISYIKNLDLDDDYKNYIIKLAQKESSFNPNVVNKQGYKGLFQMGDSALKDIGMTTDAYMSDWKNQIDAIIKYTNKHKQSLATVISSNKSRNWNGTPITEYGILGAAHLGGAKGVTNLLLSGVDKKDANQTSISDYLKYFSS